MTEGHGGWGVWPCRARHRLDSSRHGVRGALLSSSSRNQILQGCWIRPWGERGLWSFESPVVLVKELSQILVPEMDQSGQCSEEPAGDNLRLEGAGASAALRHRPRAGRLPPLQRTGTVSLPAPWDTRVFCEDTLSVLIKHGFLIWSVFGNSSCNHKSIHVDIPTVGGRDRRGCLVSSGWGGGEGGKPPRVLAQHVHR